MAKGSQNGVLKGKRGNTVFYKIANSNNKEKQGSREYVAEVKNPKTVGQAVQRVRMTPFVRFYSAFKSEILDHAFEGIAYGGQSYRHFLKKCFEMQNGFPFAQKGLSVPLPGEYLMSEGSIMPLQYAFDEDKHFVCEVLSRDNVTFGEYSQAIITASHGTIQNGDQITIATLEGDNVNTPWPKVVRFVLDTTSTEQADTYLSGIGVNISPDGVIGTYTNGWNIYGGAIIISRPSVSLTTNAVSWKRSTQKMAVNYGLPEVDALFGQPAYEAAVRSYVAAASRTVQSDWYLNQGQYQRRNASIPPAPVTLDFKVLVTPQITDDDSVLYGYYCAALLDPNTGKQLLIVDNTVDEGRTVKILYGFSADGQVDTPSNSLYQFSGQRSWIEADDAGFLDLTARYQGTITSAEATALAAENGVVLNFIMAG